MENQELIETMIPDVTITKREQFRNWCQARKEARQAKKLEKEELKLDDDYTVTKKDVVSSAVLAGTTGTVVSIAAGAGLVGTIILAATNPLLAIIVAALTCGVAWVGEDYIKKTIQEYKDTKAMYKSENPKAEKQKKNRFGKIKSLFAKSKEKKRKKEKKQDKTEKEHKIRNFFAKFRNKNNDFVEAEEIDLEESEKIDFEELDVQESNFDETVEPEAVLDTEPVQVKEPVIRNTVFSKLKPETRKVIRVEEFKVPNSGLNITQYLIDVEDEFTRRIFELGIANLAEEQLVLQEEAVVKSKAKQIYTFVK